jgi:hypothetical protein
MYALNQIGLQPVLNDVEYVDGVLRSTNPKAFDAPRAIKTCLDQPSRSGFVPLTRIYTDPLLENYRAGPYGTCDITKRYALNNAQIQYYIDPEIQGPFYSPIHDTSIPRTIRFENYVDPMGSWKPHYELTVDCSVNSCLSFINDSNFFREDLIARQQAVRNQQRSEPFL